MDSKLGIFNGEASFSAEKPWKKDARPTAPSSTSTSGHIKDVTDRHLGQGIEIIGTKRPRPDGSMGGAGAENSLVCEIKDLRSYNLLRYSSALKGDIGNKKAVIAFMFEDGGKDSLYRFQMSGSLEQISADLQMGASSFPR